MMFFGKRCTCIGNFGPIAPLGPALFSGDRYCSRCGEVRKNKCLNCGGTGEKESMTYCTVCGGKKFDRCFQCNGSGWVEHICLGH